MDNKICTKCTISKDLSFFAPHKAYKDGYSTWCRECLSERASLWSKKNSMQRQENQRKYGKRRPEVKQNSKFKQRYGISLDKFNEMSDNQKDQCLICKKHKSDNKNNKLFVDHCHSTKKVRGLLCDNCNKGLGCFRDDPSLLTKAMEYLKTNG